MAQRRMTSLDVIDTDAFFDMPQSSQLLYFHLNARADDDGFISSPKKIMRSMGSQSDDLKLLAAKKFIIEFDDGICVIKHWKINNFIRKDIYKELDQLEGRKVETISHRPRLDLFHWPLGGAFLLSLGFYLLRVWRTRSVPDASWNAPADTAKTSVENNNPARDIKAA